MWMQYMETALRNTPDSLMPMPQGVMTVNIDPTTGVKDADGMMEYFYYENPPPEDALLPLLLGDPLSNQAQQIMQPTQSYKLLILNPRDAGQSDAVKTVPNGVKPAAVPSKNQLLQPLSKHEGSMQASPQLQAVRVLNQH
jgi:penicillin-binding protein 1A